MRERKDSGIEWIGEIPVEWTSIKIKNVFYIIGGCGFKEAFQGEDDGDLPFLKASDITGSSKYVATAANYVMYDLAIHEHYNIVPPNSILMAKIGEALKKNHRKINTVECIVDNNCQALALIDAKNTDIYFAYYLMLCIDMVWFDNGGTIPCVNNRAFKDSFIYLPCITEQQIIVDYLDGKCVEIDTLTSDIETQIETLEQYKRSVITEAVTKGLDPDAEMKDSGVEFVGDIPNGWEIRRIKTLGTARNGLTYSPMNICDENEGVLVLRSSNIQNGEIDLDDNVFVKARIPVDLMVKEGDILICSRNGSVKLIGKNALIPPNICATFGAFMMIFRTEYSKYMYYVLNSSVFDYYLGTFVTSTINQLTQTNYKNMKVPFCMNQFEREEIVDFLDRKCAEIDSIIADKRTQLDTLAEYKKSLIYEYVTGKKEVPSA